MILNKRHRAFFKYHDWPEDAVYFNPLQYWAWINEHYEGFYNLHPQYEREIKGIERDNAYTDYLCKLADVQQRKKKGGENIGKVRGDIPDPSICSTTGKSRAFDW